MHPSSDEIFVLNKNIKIEQGFIWSKKYDDLTKFNIHYFDFLMSNDAGSFTKKNLDLMHDWILSNHDLKGVGWRPYTVSLRLVNWVKFINEYKVVDHEINLSIYKQLNYLIRRKEYDILANHLFSNLKAIVFTLSFLSFKGSDEIFSKNIDELCEQINEQVLKDGCHYEQSPMYQNQFLFELLDLYSIVTTSSIRNFAKLKGLLEKIIPKMAKASYILSAPDGNPSYFNDSTIDVAPNFTYIKKYLKKLGIHFNFHRPEIEHLKNGGFYRHNNNDISLIAKYGEIKCNYQAGHTHSDLASFEVYYFEKRFIVNTGVTTYEDNADRLFERSSLSKNTVTINNRGSNDVWKSFRVGRRVKRSNFDVITKDKFINEYKGFYAMARSITHKRVFKKSEKFIQIVDILNRYENNSFSKLTFSPDAEVQRITENELKIIFFNKTVYLKCSEQIKIIDSYVSGGFKQKVKATSVLMNFKSNRLEYTLNFD